jgi:uncharacterized membrane protein YtjA (UPF0391 family)
MRTVPNDLSFEVQSLLTHFMPSPPTTGFERTSVRSLFFFGRAASTAANETAPSYSASARAPIRRRGPRFYSDCIDTEEYAMLKWALIFAVIAVVAGLFGFTGIAAGAASIAKALFVIALIVFVVLIALALLGIGVVSKR